MRPRCKQAAAATIKPDPHSTCEISTSKIREYQAFDAESSHQRSFLFPLSFILLMLVLTVTDVNQALLLCKQRNAARLLVLFHLFQSLLAGLNKEKMRRCAKRAEEGGGGG